MRRGHPAREEERGRGLQARGLSFSRAPVTPSSDLLRPAGSVAAAHLGARGCWGRGCRLPRPPRAAVCRNLQVLSLPTPPHPLSPGARQAGSLPLGSVRAGGFGLRGGGGGGASERARGAGASAVSHRYLERERRRGSGAQPEPDPSASVAECGRPRPRRAPLRPSRPLRPRPKPFCRPRGGSGLAGGCHSGSPELPATSAATAAARGNRDNESPVRPLRKSGVSHGESQLPG